jgi:prophage regulatory protein
MSKAILRLSAVRSRTGLSRSSLYSKIAKGLFPRPMSLGSRAVGWFEEDVDRWLDSLVEKQRPCSDLTKTHPANRALAQPRNTDPQLRSGALRATSVRPRIGFERLPLR